MKNQGFTLVELAVVAAVMVILAVGFSMVFGQVINSTRVDGATRQIMSDLEHVRQLAETKQTTHGIQFTYRSSYTAYEGTTATPITRPMKGGSMIVTIGDDFPSVYINTNYTVEFNSFGAPSTGGGGSLVVTDGVVTRTITVASGTGRISMQ